MSILLDIDNVVTGYHRDLPIVHGVTMQVSKGAFVTLIGPNGAGKSTLLKACAGLLFVSSGAIRLAGRDVTNTEAHQLAESSIGYVPQTANVFTTLTIDENLRLGAASLPGKQASAAVAGAYQRFPALVPFRRAKAKGLSGGQRQMLAVARALLTKPQLLMLDEPSAGLSPLMVQEVFALLRNLVDEGITILMVEQNVKAAFAVADHAYVLAEGSNRLDGTPAQLGEMDEIARLYLGGGGRK